jgi:hypothetical protein
MRVFLVLFLMSVAGCDRTETKSSKPATNTAVQGDFGGTDIWPSTATKLRAESSGAGELPEEPPGSNCSLGDAKYELDPVKRSLTYSRCTYAEGKPWRLDRGTTKLSKDAFGKVDDALKALSISKSDRCGADKEWATIEISTPAGTKEYTDSFYACHRGKGWVFVDNMDEVFRAFREAVR